MMSPFRRVRNAIAAGVGLAVLLVACQSAGPSSRAWIAIRTLPTPLPSVPTICLEAKGGGTLVEDPVSGLGFTDAAGHQTHVWWPIGYASILDGGRLALVDATGRVIAHVGDVVGTAGGFVSDGDWEVCSSESIEVLATPAPST